MGAQGGRLFRFLFRGESTVEKRRMASGREIPASLSKIH
jgi:hypothetical protein